MLALAWTLWRAQKILYLLGLAVPLLLALHPGVRAWTEDRPRSVLAGIVVLDLLYYLWATVPFVPLGVDESLFVVNAHALHGAEVGVTWIRTPLPVVGAALVPWHPPLIGLLFREVAVVSAFALGRRGLGNGAGILAAWWTVAAGHLGAHSCRMLSEPYGAGCLALFAVLVVAGKWRPGALVAGLAFASRWQLGILVLPALWCAARGGRREGAPWVRVPVAAVLFALPVAVLAPLTGSDPLRAFLRESTHATTLVERLLAYAHPASGFGMGLLGAVLVGIGIASQLRRGERRPAVAWCAVLFVLTALPVLAIGIVTTRFFAPLVPLGVVLMVAGALCIVRRWPRVGRPGWGGLGLAVVTLSLALPARVAKSRAEAAGSPLRVLRDHRSEVESLLGAAPLFSDYQILAVTAILGRRCHAVTWSGSEHPRGLSLSFEGAVPDLSRDALPPGSLYLTLDPGGRPSLWAGGGLSLVRW